MFGCAPSVKAHRQFFQPPERAGISKWTLLFAAGCLVPAASSLRAAEWNYRLDMQMRGFMHSPAYPAQKPHGASIAMEAEYFNVSQNGRDSLVVEPFLRLDSTDGERSTFDIRELMYQRNYDSAELRVGIGRVFWGVTESFHLIDTVNQTDYLEDLDGEAKLGQPMVNLSLIRNWGIVDLFALPAFRERPFPGSAGRLRTEPVADADRASHESGAGRGRVDYALRWTGSFAAVDIGLAHFRGTAREPRLLPACDAQVCDAVSGAGFVFTPHYELTRRDSLDLQVTGNATLWKLEALHETRRSESWHAWVAGLEHAWYGVLGTGVDMGLFVEHLFDSRDAAAPQPFENDVFTGARLTFNNAADTDILFGAIADLDDRSTVLVLEATHRLADRWAMAVVARVWTGIAQSDPLYPLRQDDYLELTLSRFF